MILSLLHECSNPQPRKTYPSGIEILSWKTNNVYNNKVHPTTLKTTVGWLVCIIFTRVEHNIIIYCDAIMNETRCARHRVVHVKREKALRKGNFDADSRVNG